MNSNLLTSVTLLVFAAATAAVGWLFGLWALLIWFGVAIVSSTVCLASLRGVDAPEPAPELDLQRLLTRRPPARERDPLTEQGRVIFFNLRTQPETNGHTPHPER